MNTNDVAYIEKQMEETLTKYHPVGLAVGVIQNGEIAFTKGVGLANLTTKQPVTPQTIFRVASISKTLTAVATMQLIEQNRFQLDDPANKHLTSFQIQQPKKYAPITVRHLLTHTSGLGELAPVLSYINPKTAYHVIAHRFGKQYRLPMSEFYAGRLKPDSPPGVKWSYANHGFGVLEQLIADVSGQPFPEYMRDHVLNPIGMTQSAFERQESWKHPALGYKVDQKGQASPVVDIEAIPQGAGGLFTSIEELSQYAKALMLDGNPSPMLKEQTLRQMYHPHYKTADAHNAMGLGFNVRQWRGHQIAFHDGLWLGFMSSMWLAPEAGLGVLVFMNTAHSSAVWTAKRIFDHLLEAKPAVQLEAGVSVKPQPEQWAELEGTYGPKPGWNSNFRLWTSYGGELTVKQEEGQLKLYSRIKQWKNGHPLKPVQGNGRQFLISDWTRVTFAETPDGMALHLNQHTFYKRQHKRQSIAFQQKLLTGAVGAMGIASVLLNLKKRKKNKQ